ncbi:hypothetical protein YIM_15510 [Amycolatopsis sp. YIM 10]|nr:hypothetical protein YIM_15510 [Amycolatopsis sp. YIM 10]
MLLDEADRSDEAGEEFDALPPDADEDVRGRLAERFAPSWRRCSASTRGSRILLGV